MGNKQTATASIAKKINKYKNVNNDLRNDSQTASTHSPLPNGQTVLTNKGRYSGSGHLPSVNSTRSSFSSDIMLNGGHRLSFTASNSTTMTLSSFGNYPDLPPLQHRIDKDVLYLIIMYMDILSRLQISLCCKYFNKIILSEQCLSDVWIIHGLTHRKYLWEVPTPNMTKRYHRKIRSQRTKHNQSQQQLSPQSISTSSLSSSATQKPLKKKKQKQKKPKHTRASSYSFSVAKSQKKKKINIIGGRNNKRRQSTMNNDIKQKRKQQIPRSLPPEKIFGIEDLKENDGNNNNKNNNNDNNGNNKDKTDSKNDKMRSISRSKSSSTVLSGKNLIISTSNDHGIIIMQQHHRMTSNRNLNIIQDDEKTEIGNTKTKKSSDHKNNKNNVISINLRPNNNNNNNNNNLKVKKEKKRHKRKHHHHHHHQRFFHELSEFNVIVADFKKYLLQFSPIIKYSRCLVVGADGLPNTLKDFTKLRWIESVMTIEYLVLEQSNDSIASEILNSFAHSLKYLSIRGDIDESLDLYDLNINALRICLSLNQSKCKYLWAAIPLSLKYLSLYKSTFVCNLLNKSLHGLYNNLLHLSLIDVTMESSSSSSSSSLSSLKLPPSLLSLHIKNFKGQLSLINCKRLWEIVLFIDMKGYNQLNKTQLNVINISSLMESLEVTKNIIQQIVFFEYNNYDEFVLPNQLFFSDWKDVNNLLVVVPEHWLNDDKFKQKFQGSTFSNIKKDIVYYYNNDIDDDDDIHNDNDNDNEEKKNDDNDKLLPFNQKEKQFRKELRQRVGYSMFGDFYNNNHFGEFSLSKFVRNGHHQLNPK